MSEIYYPDSDMDQEEKDINNRIAELVEFKCWKKGSRCDGKLITRCGACGGYGHANCYGNGSGAIQFACCQERPNYTQNIEKAWELVEGLDVGIVLTKYRDTPTPWTISLFEGCKMTTVSAETLPLAICKAFVEWKETG